MQLGISSFTYGWAVGLPGYPPAQPLTPFDILARATALGVRVVQFGDNMPLDCLPDTDRQAVLARGQHLGLRFEVGTRGIAPDHLRNYLAIARQFGSPFLRVVIDTPEHAPSPEEIVRLLGEVMPEFAAAGVVLAIENHDRLPARTLVRILEQLDSPYVGICLDVANSFGCSEGPEYVITTLAPYAVNLHIKDYAVERTPYGLGFTIQGRPVGIGQLDVPWVLQAVRDTGRDMNTILEQWTPLGPSVEETIAREEAWAAQSIAYLREFISG